MTFEENWPEISSKLARLLAARRVPDCQRDDIMQETAVRLFRAWDRLDPAQGAWGLARAIALHAIADGAAARARYELEELAEVPDRSDPERAGIARFHLSSVRRALSQMSPIDRSILLAEVGAATSPALGRSAMKMARSRARRRLRILVEKPGSWATLPHLSLRIKTYGRRLMHERVLMYPQFAEGAIATMVALALTVTTMGNGTDAAGPRRSTDDIGPGRSIAVVAARTTEPTHAWTASERRELSASHRDYASAHEDPDRRSGEHWLKESAAMAKRDAEQAGKEAKRLGKEAEYLAYLVEEETKRTGKEAERLGKEAEYLADLAQEEAKNLRRLAEELPP
jgi:DNA-directed RNA polymerase specialized sigma24 family protein